MLYHITPRADWDATATTYRAPSLESQGFIHLSATPDQVTRVANGVYAEQDDLIVLCIDADRLMATVKYEPPDPTVPAEHDDGERFPHLYGALNTDAVTAIHPLRRDESGQYVYPMG